MNTAHIISHASCPDGFGSAYMIDHIIRSRPDFGAIDIVHWPVGYEHEMFKAGADLSFTRDAMIYIVDFCPPAHWLDQVAGHAQSVFVLDHHQTAAEQIIPELRKYAVTPPGYEIFDSVDAWENGPSANFEIVIDQSHSGVGLVAQYARVCGLSPDKILWFWPYIEDRDLWKFELSNTTDVMAALAAVPYDFGEWEALHRSDIIALTTAGKAINTFRDQLVDACTAKPFYLDLDSANTTALCCNAPYTIGSDCAGKLATQSATGLGAYIIIHGDDIQVGLRSTPDGPDCAQIAQKYGGGGHKHASGLRLSHTDLDYVVRQRHASHWSTTAPPAPSIIDRPAGRA